MNKPSPYGQPAPVRFPLDDERRSRTVKFRMVVAVDDLVDRCTLEDDLYDKEMGPQSRVVEGYLTVSTYADGTPGEVFLTMGKEGHEMHGWADKWSRFFSMLLQFGVAPTAVYESMKFQAFEPNGITNLPQVPLCKSIPDLVVRWMEATFPPTAAATQSNEYDAVLETLVSAEDEA